MVAFNIYLAGGTERHATAAAFYRELVGFAELHEVEVHICRPNELMLLRKPVYDGYSDFVVRHNLLIFARKCTQNQRPVGMLICWDLYDGRSSVY